MSQNFIAPGKVLTVTAPYALASGGGCKVGKIFGVATAKSLISVAVEIDTEGVHELTKVGTQAWSVGDDIFWDDGNVRCTSDSAAGMRIGVCTEAVAAGAGDVLGRVKLGQGEAGLEGAQAAVVTLTDSTGASAGHDDTLADGLTLTAAAAVAAYAAVVNMTNPVTKTEGEAVSAALAALVLSVDAQRAKIDVILTDLTVQNQNTSDLGQKVIEILNRLVAAGLIDA